MTTLISPSTLAAYMGGDVDTRMSGSLHRAEAMAASKIGCKSLRLREVTESIRINDELEVFGDLSSPSYLLKQRQVFLSDGPARSLTSVSLNANGSLTNLLSTAELSGTGWSVRYRLPVFISNITAPHNDYRIDVTYEAGWENEASLPEGVREYVLARALSDYHLPLGSAIIKVRIGDSYVDLNPDGLTHHLDELEETLSQWKRVKL